MLAEGLLDEPRPDRSLALHLWNVKPVGWVGVTPGPVMAASDGFKIRLVGLGGHGASPHLTVDPILAAAQIITAAQSIVARNVAPLDSAVVTFATVHAGNTYNVIPAELEMEGTIRTFDPRVRRRVLDRFRQLVEGLASALGCQAELRLLKDTPPVVNHPGITAGVQALVPRILPGVDLDTQARTMGSEDMAFIMNEIPGCYFFVGSANPDKGLDAVHHNPGFDFDEDALPNAVALMAAAAMDLLEK
jgi:amidohydrolase